MRFMTRSSAAGAGTWLIGTSWVIDQFRWPEMIKNGALISCNARYE
jgi:hypothetical protein